MTSCACVGTVQGDWWGTKHVVKIISSEQHENNGMHGHDPIHFSEHFDQLSEHLTCLSALLRTIFSAEIQLSLSNLEAPFVGFFSLPYLAFSLYLMSLTTLTPPSIMWNS